MINSQYNDSITAEPILFSRASALINRAAYSKLTAQFMRAMAAPVMAAILPRRLRNRALQEILFILLGKYATEAGLNWNRGSWTSKNLGNFISCSDILQLSAMQTCAVIAVRKAPPHKKNRLLKGAAIGAGIGLAILTPLLLFGVTWPKSKDNPDYSFTGSLDLLYLELLEYFSIVLASLASAGVLVAHASIQNREIALHENERPAPRNAL